MVSVQEGVTYAVILKDGLNITARSLLGALVTFKGRSPEVSFGKFKSKAYSAGKQFFIKRFSDETLMGGQEHCEEVLWSMITEHRARFEAGRAGHDVRNLPLPYIPPVRVYSAFEVLNLCVDQGLLPASSLEALG